MRDARRERFLSQGVFLLGRRAQIYGPNGSPTEQKKQTNRGPFCFFLLILQQRKLNLISVSVKKRRETCRDKDQGRLLCLQLKR
jgi:hypothetical protein